MYSRFATNMLFLFAGGTMIVCSQAYPHGVISWIAFGIGLGILAAAGLAQLDRRRGGAQLGLDAVCALLALWTVVVSMVYTGATVEWLSFGEGFGFVGLALVGLIAHELSAERVVHSLVVHKEQRPSDTYAKAA